jgi:hypothetical protein
VFVWAVGDGSDRLRYGHALRAGGSGGAEVERLAIADARTRGSMPGFARALCFGGAGHRPRLTAVSPSTKGAIETLTKAWAAEARGRIGRVHRHAPAALFPLCH